MHGLLNRSLAVGAGIFWRERLRDLTVGQVVEFMEGPIVVTAGSERESNKKESFFEGLAFEQVWWKLDGAISQVCNETTFAELPEHEKTNRPASVSNYVI